MILIPGSVAFRKVFLYVEEGNVRVTLYAFSTSSWTLSSFILSDGVSRLLF